MLCEVLKGKHPEVRRKAAAHLRQYRQFTLSSITRYETLRGLKQRRARRQLQRFHTFCRHSLILPITDDILNRAADLWGTAYDGGHPRNDADLIVAATALHHGRTLVTGNVHHFNWIIGLPIEDWRQP